MKDNTIVRIEQPLGLETLESGVSGFEDRAESLDGCSTAFDPLWKS